MVSTPAAFIRELFEIPVLDSTLEIKCNWCREELRHLGLQISAM